ncbi:DUF1365 family protein [Staphylococcus epidermidis]|nr:DUF1365 family protein [Staphylococcus epidermidis]
MIGFGQIWHRRLRPVEHAFRGYFLLLPAKPALASGCSAAAQSPRWLSFHDSDHGDGSPDSLAWFESCCRMKASWTPMARYGCIPFRVCWAMPSPVSFWYAHRAGWLAGSHPGRGPTPLARHAYLLAGQLAWDCEQVAHKCFHVSPFCETQARVSPLSSAVKTPIWRSWIFTTRQGRCCARASQGHCVPNTLPQCARLSSARR